VAILSQSEPESNTSDLKTGTGTGFFVFIKTLHWGEYSLLALYISVLSGVIVALQYDPATPFYSVSTMDLLVPFGAYFRSLHFYSSQFFFLFSIIHLIAVFEETQKFSQKQWALLSLSIPVALLVLFTGYVLRGDSTGYSAGMIAEAIILDIPWIGQNINDLLFSISENGMKRIYVNHIIAFGLLWGWMVWGHVKKYKISFERNLMLTFGILLFSVFILAPFEPDHLGVTHIAGPWFFLGLQELLRYMPPLIAGMLIPLTFLLALFFLQKKNSSYLFCLYFIIGWLLCYTVLTAIALNR
jgi:quinol-cytochrome oxidoreductase complex cytochrome b subunit